MTNFSNPDFQPFLKNPSLVSGAALVGDSSCDVLQLNISVSLKDPGKKLSVLCAEPEGLRSREF